MTATDTCSAHVPEGSEPSHHNLAANTLNSLCHWLLYPTWCWHLLSSPERDAPLQSGKIFPTGSLSFSPPFHLSQRSVIFPTPWTYSSSQASQFFSLLYWGGLWAQPLTLKDLLNLVALFPKKFTQWITLVSDTLFPIHTSVFGTYSNDDLKPNNLLWRSSSPLAASLPPGHLRVCAQS